MGVDEDRRSLLDHEPSELDREAELDEPRPGVWRSDGTPISQAETDLLIRHELFWVTAAEDRDELRVIVGDISGLWIDGEQRGGIDTDPLVRVLARRAWGDRDRGWFERYPEVFEQLRELYGFDRLVIDRDPARACFVATAGVPGRIAQCSLHDVALAEATSPVAQLWSMLDELAQGLGRQLPPRTPLVYVPARDGSAPVWLYPDGDGGLAVVQEMLERAAAATLEGELAD